MYNTCIGAITLSMQTCAPRALASHAISWAFFIRTILVTCLSRSSKRLLSCMCLPICTARSPCSKVLVAKCLKFSSGGIKICYRTQ